MAAPAALAAALFPTAQAARCLSDCTPRIGIVSAFGAEADLLLARLQHPKTWTITGKRFTTGELEGHRVVVVLSGVSIVNATLTTQQLLDHFRIDRLVMSGIAGGVNPANHVGDVTVPDRWAMPLETFWNDSDTLPAPCGPTGDLSCLGLNLAAPDGQPCRPSSTSSRAAPTCSMPPTRRRASTASTTRWMRPCWPPCARCSPCSAAAPRPGRPMARWTRSSA
jgi:adenosylhomocysteine nucleosidase